ncbi:NAD-dependent deacetylase, partial [Myxococcota bacterium]|nr:NAD-dependent deacetylase [Myxococcota bacterium]
GPKGLWTKNPDAEKQANLQYYLADPEVRKRSWESRISGEMDWGSVAPNDGHRALVELEKRGKLDLLVTQNVDGLHQKAGNSAQRVVEIHGTLQEFMCMSCEDRGPVEVVLERVRAGEGDPPCLECGGILKAAVVSFGQNLFPGDMERSIAAASTCDLILAVGTTLGVFPAANVVPAAKQSGAQVVIVNGSPTEMDDLADAILRGSISEILPSVVGTSTPN